MESLSLKIHPSTHSTIPARHYNAICRFEFQREYDKALRYREADVPFILTNIPAFDALVEKWSAPDYLPSRLSDGQLYRVDASASNRFKNYEPPVPPEWTPPYNVTQMPFEEWHARVQVRPNARNDEPHYYFRFFGDQNAVIGEDFDFVFDEAKRDPLFFAMPAQPNFFRCRWGMAGNVAEPHFDGPRNMAFTVTGAAVVGCVHGTMFITD